MKPQSERAWLAGGVVAAAVLAAAGWFGAIGPQLSHTASLKSQQSDLRFQNDRMLAKTQKLKADSAQLPQLTQSLSRALQALPEDSNMSEFTIQLTKQAAANHVVVKGIDLSGPALVTGPGGATPAVVGSVAGKVFGIPVTLTTAGSFIDQRRYLDAVQHQGSRAALVRSIKLVPIGAANGSVDSNGTMISQLTVFVTPLSPAERAAMAKLLAAGATPAS